MTAVGFYALNMSEKLCLIIWQKPELVFVEEINDGGVTICYEKFLFVLDWTVASEK